MLVRPIPTRPNDSDWSYMPNYAVCSNIEQILLYYPSSSLLPSILYWNISRIIALSRDDNENQKSSCDRVYRFLRKWLLFLCSL